MIIIRKQHLKRLSKALDENRQGKEKQIWRLILLIKQKKLTLAVYSLYERNGMKGVPRGKTAAIAFIDVCNSANASLHSVATFISI